MLKKKLLICFWSSALFLLLLSCGRNYITPPPQFLESTISASGMNKFPFGQITIAQFVSLLQAKQFNGGKRANIQGWTKNDDTYTLHALLSKEDLEFEFTHPVTGTDKGKNYSLINGGRNGGESLSDFKALELIMGL